MRSPLHSADRKALEMPKFKSSHGPVVIYLRGGYYEFEADKPVEVNNRAHVAQLRKSPDLVEVKEKPKARAKD